MPFGERGEPANRCQHGHCKFTPAFTFHPLRAWWASFFICSDPLTLQFLFGDCWRHHHLHSVVGAGLPSCMTTIFDSEESLPARWHRQERPPHRYFLSFPCAGMVRISSLMSATAPPYGQEPRQGLSAIVRGEVGSCPSQFSCFIAPLFVLRCWMATLDVETLMQRLGTRLHESQGASRPPAGAHTRGGMLRGR